MIHSLGILKPDSVEKGLTQTILDMIRERGFKIVALKELELSIDQMQILYERCVHKEFWPVMLEFMTSGSVIVFVVEKEDAINDLNRLVGETDPAHSKRDTVRGLYGESVKRNAIHSSMNSESFCTEIRLFFTEVEILNMFSL